MADPDMDAAIDTKIKLCKELMQLKEEMNALAVDTSGVIAALGMVFEMTDGIMTNLTVDTSVDTKIKECRSLMKLKEEMDALNANTAGVVAALGEVFDITNERMTSSVMTTSVEVKFNRCKELMQLQKEMDALSVNTSGVIAALGAVFQVTCVGSICKIPLTGHSRHE